MTHEQEALLDLLARVQRLEAIERDRTLAAHIKAVCSEQKQKADRQNAAR